MPVLIALLWTLPFLSAQAPASRPGSDRLSGMFHDKEGSRAHGLNERIRVTSLLDGREFLYEIVKIYANLND